MINPSYTISDNVKGFIVCGNDFVAVAIYLSNPAHSKTFEWNIYNNTSAYTRALQWANNDGKDEKE